MRNYFTGKSWPLSLTLMFVAGFLAYHNSFTGSFIFDDKDSILQNPTIRHLWPIWDVLSPPSKSTITIAGRPIINVSLAVNYALGGTQVRGYHVLNLMIHILAGLTLLGVVHRTLLQPRLRERFGAVANELALAMALLWTVHPLQTESVTYVIQRAESMMGLFYLLTLYCFIRGAGSPRPGRWYGLCVSACALGMACKEVMVSAPLMVMLYDRAFLSGSLREAWRRRWPLHLALAGTWVVLGYLLFFTGRLTYAFSYAKSVRVVWWEYLLTEPGVVLHYLRLSVWPYPLCLGYYGSPTIGPWTSILPPTLVMVILLGATAWAWKINSAWGFLGAWFFLILAPTSSFMPTDSLAYEHRMYLSLAAVVALVVVGAFVIGKRLSSKQSSGVLAWLAGGIVVLVLAILTVHRNQDYSSELAICQDTAVKYPNNVRAHNNLGLALAQVGKLDDAIGHYEQALRIKPDYAEAHNNLGNALLQTGRIEAAVGHLEQALQTDPDFAEAHYNLGLALVRLGRLQEAIGHWERALRINPDSAEVHNNLGVALEQAGRLQDAIGHYEQALRIKPDYAKAHYNLGAALEQAGRLQDAIGHYEQALRIKPDFTEAENELARVRAGQ
jgi:tetratricopeptide (TPR) repeat protein